MKLFSDATRVCIIPLFTAVLLTLGCGGSSSQTRLRFADMSPDQPSLDLLVDGNNVGTVALGSSSAYLSVSSGSRHLQIEPTGSTNILIDENHTFNSSSDTTLLALNFTSGIYTLAMNDDNSAPGSGDFKVRLINASPWLGTADVYAVTSGTDITNVSPTVSNLAFGAFSNYISLPAGTYQVMFTAPGQKFAFINTGAVTLSAGQVRTVVGLNTVSGYTTAVLSDLN